MGIDQLKLNKAIVNAFKDSIGTKGTFAIAIAYKNQLIAEKFQTGFSDKNLFLSWSMGKSITQALVGIMVKQGQLDIYKPTDIDNWKNTDKQNISINNLMQMTSGLKWNENYGNRSDVTLMPVSYTHLDVYKRQAYTAVDKAEDDQELCYKINKDAVKNIAEVALKNQLKVIHISTDYVFNGKSYIPYSEDMEVCPTSVYGKSKLAGEQELLEICLNSTIIRTSWLYSSFGNNFVKTMIKLGTERDKLTVIFDQVGTPTYAADLATVIFKIICSKEYIPGIYHFSNEGVCSWYDFTKTIHRLQGIHCHVLPIETKDYRCV